MRVFFAFCAYVAGLLQNYFWEFIRAGLYEKGLHMMAPHMEGLSIESVVHYGSTLALIGTGTWLIWPSRPEILRRRPISIFLERDSESDRFGIQTFPEISYIQLSITTRTALTRCRAWSTRVEYSPDNFVPYAKEHGERHPLTWSKHGGPSHFEADINPGEPSLRLNIAIFNHEGIQFEPTAQTPTNLLPSFQRIGFHRLTINLSAFRRGSPISEIRRLTINWRGSNNAIVLLE